MAAIIITDLTIFKEGETNIGYTSVTSNELASFVEFEERNIIEALFGNSFAYELLAAPTSTRFKTIIDGATYAVDGYNYRFAGLKKLLQHMIYIDYTSQKQYLNANVGNYQPTQTNAAPANAYMVKEKMLFSARYAKKCAEEIQDYIEENFATYADLKIEYGNISLFEYMF